MDPIVQITSNLKKRKAQGEATFPLDDLHQDLLERVLARVPPSSFFSLRSVCRRFSSVATSPSFHVACSQIDSREPWFLMVDHDLHRASLVFDSSEKNWRSVKAMNNSNKSIPVASSGGLVCYKTEAGELFVSNPVTGVCRELPSVTRLTSSETLHAIAMHSSKQNPSAYRVVLVFGEIPNLAFVVFDSAKNLWEEEVTLVRKTDSSSDVDVNGEEEVYFLSKTGDVVASNMQRSPSKQYSSVLTIENGEEMLYFLSHSGTVISCNLTQRTFFELPRLLPVYFEYSIDVIECGGEMLVVVLSEFLETSSLRFWKYSSRDRSWYQVAAMPASLSHEFYAKKVDINCVGHGDEVLLCVNSSECSSCLMCDLKNNKWVEMPKCYVDGKEKEFLSAFPFEPRLEAIV
ncbi:F-box only protein [Rhynchospora pubera]|uniref:F-box only protein n=1 Tax=Rhynchospora pubera TaxID=906938 RepID=A0AAV8HIG2_9POAL|nr:F-box only protein [Rhynchospora pubera]KAJ4814607.1 F-box only protein [Rhynchospora pubera]